MTAANRLHKALINTGHELVLSVRSFITLVKLFLRASLARFPFLFLLVIAALGLGAMAISMWYELISYDLASYISGLEVPSMAVYGTARIVCSVIGALQVVMFPAALFIVLHGASSQIIEQERTVLVQPASPRVLGVARVLVIMLPIILLRVMLITFGLGLYGLLLFQSNAEFVLLFLPTIWAPIVVAVVHDLFFYSMIFMLGRLLRHVILGIVSVYLIHFPSPSYINDLFLYIPSGEVPGGLLHSELSVLFLFYSVLQPSSYSYPAWQSIGCSFGSREALSQVIGIWIVGAFLFAWLSIEITRRIARG